MKNELKIIKNLEEDLKILIPIQELSFYIEEKNIPNSGQAPDFIASISYNNQCFKLMGEILSQKYLPVFKNKISKLKSYVKDHQDCSGLIISPYLSQDRRDECKNADINFIDLSGNVFIKLDGLYIEREGFPNRFPEKRNGRSLFSDKASLVLRAMMQKNEGNWGIRQLANEAGLDPGFVSRLARELEDRDYAVRSGSAIKLREPKFILDDWVRDYKHKKNHAYPFFCMAENPEQILDRMRGLSIGDQKNYVLSFHAGASLIAPYAVFNEVHVYVQDHEDIEFFRENLGLREANGGANFILAIPFYKNSAFYRKQKAKDLWVASDIQLYLDLYHYPLRGLEQAEYLYDKRLKSVIEA